jgi:hypothetical protein
MSEETKYMLIIMTFAFCFHAVFLYDPDKQTYTAQEIIEACEAGRESVILEAIE